MLLTRQHLYNQLLRSLGKCCTVLGRLHGYRKKNTYTNQKRQWSWMNFKGIVAWDGFWSILSFLVWIESVPLFCQLLLLASSTCWGKIKAVVNLWSSRQRWVSTQASPSTGRRRSKGLNIVFFRTTEGKNQDLYIDRFRSLLIQLSSNQICRFQKKNNLDVYLD